MLNLVSQVLQQWTRVAADSALKMTPSPSPPRVQSPTDLHPYVDDDYSEDYVPPSTKSKPRPRCELIYFFLIYRISVMFLAVKMFYLCNDQVSSILTEDKNGFIFVNTA